MGALVLNDARIAERCLVAAGALAPEGFSCAERSLVIGSPAKVSRELTDDEVDSLEETAREYRTNIDRHRVAYAS